MRSTKTLFAVLFLLSCCGAVWGQAAKTDQPQTVTQVLDRSVSNVEHEFVSAADAMPEDKFVLHIADRTIQHLSQDRKSTRLNSSHSQISYAVFCLKKKNNI